MCNYIFCADLKVVILRYYIGYSGIMFFISKSHAAISFAIISGERSESKSFVPKGSTKWPRFCVSEGFRGSFKLLTFTSVFIFFQSFLSHLNVLPYFRLILRRVLSLLVRWVFNFLFLVNIFLRLSWFSVFALFFLMCEVNVIIFLLHDITDAVFIAVFVYSCWCKVRLSFIIRLLFSIGQTLRQMWAWMLFTWLDNAMSCLIPFAYMFLFFLISHR